MVGRVTRISPEAPVPVVAFDHEEYAPRRRRQRRPQHRRPRRARRSSAWSAHDAARRACREQLDGRGGVGRRARRRITAAADDREGARRHRAQPAGGAHRLRDGHRGHGGRRGSRSSDARRALAAGRRRAPRVRLPERRDHARRSWHALVGWRASAACRCSSIRRFRTSTPTRGATLITPNHHEAEMATQRRIRTRRGRQRRGARVPRRAPDCDGVLDHARRARHVAVADGLRRVRCRQPRGKWPT